MPDQPHVARVSKVFLLAIAAKVEVRPFLHVVEVVLGSVGRRRPCRRAGYDGFWAPWLFLQGSVCRWPGYREITVIYRGPTVDGGRQPGYPGIIQGTSRGTTDDLTEDMNT